MTILQLDEHVNLGGLQTRAGGADEVDGDDCDYEKIACKCDKMPITSSPLSSMQSDLPSS